ncbi:hypothetical protein [Acuticoccus sp.]|uniref:hypothetical protein n=1 Tax=Acuticoccus sp. TaxID=1904378 RepID=UPI003B518AA0
MHGPPPDGPGSEPPPGPRAFATGYKVHSGDMMVYGGGAMTVVGVLASVVNGAPVFLLASVVGSLSALYFWPTIDPRRPQLGASVQGIYIARVGIIPWANVGEMRVEHHALRTMHLATLVVVPRVPLAEAVARREVLPLAERYAARNARVRANVVRVSLHTLAMPIAEVEARLVALRSAAGHG